jgi:hypothetical protein
MSLVFTSILHFYGNDRLKFKIWPYVKINYCVVLFLQACFSQNLDWFESGMNIHVSYILYYKLI